MTNLSDINSSIRIVRSRLDARRGELRALERSATRLQEDTEELQSKIVTYDQAVSLLNTIGEERQNQAHRQIESLVTQGLHTIFGPGLSFHLVQIVRDKRPEVEFVIRTTLIDGRTFDTAALGARGGGLSAMVGLLLRIVVLVLSHKDKSTPLFLDEPLAFLSAKYAPLMVTFIKELVDKTKVQVVLSTHIHREEVAAISDKLYFLALVDGITQVREITVSDIT